MYYDIRPAMSAKDWIAARVIAPEFKTQGSEFVARAKMALFGVSPRHSSLSGGPGLSASSRPAGVGVRHPSRIP